MPDHNHSSLRPAIIAYAYVATQLYAYTPSRFGLGKIVDEFERMCVGRTLHARVNGQPQRPAHAHASRPMDSLVALRLLLLLLLRNSTLAWKNPFVSRRERSSGYF